MYDAPEPWDPEPLPEVLLVALARAVDGLAGVDPGAASQDGRQRLLGGVWRETDRLHALLAQLARAADVAGDWTAVGATSCRSWLAQVAGTTPGAAAAHLRVGAALERLRAVARAALAGDVPWAATEVLATTTTSGGTAALAERDEDLLLQQATELRLAQLVQAVRHWRARAEAEAGDGSPPDPRERRSFRLGTASDGFAVGSLTLDPEGAAVVTAALGPLMVPIGPHDRRKAARRRADALVELCAAHLAGRVEGGHHGPTLLVQVPVATLTGEGDAPGRTADGTLVPPIAVRRLACHGALRRVVLDTHGLPLDVGRRHRFATPAIWAALVARDRGCSHPWCERPPGWCQAHHVNGAWADPATITSVATMALACDHHHHLVHEGGWHVTVEDGRPHWWDLTGTWSSRPHTAGRPPDEPSRPGRRGPCRVGGAGAVPGRRSGAAGAGARRWSGRGARAGSAGLALGRCAAVEIDGTCAGPVRRQQGCTRPSGRVRRTSATRGMRSW